MAIELKTNAANRAPRIEDLAHDALAAHALTRAIEECPNTIYNLGDARQWINDSASSILTDLLAGKQP